ncbi:hypothetical protein MKEN_00687500 [Mycena kentingensis (nom. inval.)]|nr:hypothetical protein MKEN_00687500 [Mycena kentingensis (nom. inval.)]
MAALAPANAVPIPQLCDYCKQKPRHAGHPFCSKTCAAQIAALCNQCKLRPKHQNFDYCGKNCAAAAAAAGGKAPVAVGSRPAIKAAPKTTPNANGPQFGTTSIGGVTIDPMQIAKLVAQHIPQVQSFMTAVTPALGPQGQVQVQAGAPPPAPAAAQRATPKNNPFVNAGGSVPVKVNAPVVIPQAAAMTTPAAPNGASMPVPDCLIPGCGQPVHVDASTGTMSEYCSKKHREEAVSLGLVAPCIMCLALPQSESDYFCGRECREDALTKNVHP